MRGVIERLRNTALCIVPLVLAFLSIVVTPHLRAAQPTVTVRVSADSLYAGERIVCIADVQHLTGTAVSVELPDSAALSPFMLIGRKQSSKPLSASANEERIELEFAVFGSGSQRLPPLTLVFFDARGRISDRQEFRPAAVFVKTLTPQDMLELRPLKPPTAPGFPFTLILSVLIGIPGFAAAVLLVLFLVKRKVRLFAEAVDPAQVANRKLRKLDARLSSGMPPSECYAELSTIMREYLERHFHIPALEAVTPEIERDLRKLGISSFEAVMSILRQADLVKFADSRPTAEESRNSIRQAGEIVRSPGNGGV
ncbi:hypothetical protein [Chlorobium sp.]|uniref:hypothetical protein n=1 Tax=Chlorobium sp. TaxID=1095 RepID=UPI002F42EB45